MQQKSLFTYWLECFTKHYVDFSGRARRREYWGTLLFNSLFSIALSMISKELSLLYSLVFFLPGIAVVVRRFHDIGKSGWNVLWGGIPIVGIIMIIYWFCQDSQPEENKWGANPKFVNPE